MLASPELVTFAKRMVREHGSKTMWYRHPDALIRYQDDVRLIVLHLREYGGWKEWGAAQELQKCLSPHSRNPS